MTGGIFMLIFRGGEKLIEVKINLHGIRMKGHAGYHNNGADVVCAAVSALTCNLVNSLQELTDNKIRAETGSGTAVIEWEELSEQGKLLVDSWFLGIAGIDNMYNCVKFD